MKSMVHSLCALLTPFLAVGSLTANMTETAAFAAVAVAADGLSGADLEELLAPIALYPDPLLANVLAASCYPDELSQASRGSGNASDWEPSVQAVAKIPDALKMLTSHPEWTKAVGEAFILQSPDLMAAVQRLRARAYANGALKTTQQQIVIPQNDTIIIQPAQPEVIYVPSYQPSVVYVDNQDDNAAAGVIGFGLGITAGLIIANNVDCDWGHGGCCYGCGWGHGHGDVDININNNQFNNNQINNINNNGNSWKPNQTKLGNDIRSGNATSLNSYKGIGTGQWTGAAVPNRSTNAVPIARTAAPRPSQTAATRSNGYGAASAPVRPQGQSTYRPESMNRPPAQRAMPSVPPTSQRSFEQPSGGGWDSSSRSAPSRSYPSAYGGGAGSGSSRSASRGSSSRGSHSRGGRGR